MKWTELIFPIVAFVLIINGGWGIFRKRIKPKNKEEETQRKEAKRKFIIELIIGFIIMTVSIIEIVYTKDKSDFEEGELTPLKLLPSNIQNKIDSSAEQPPVFSTKPIKDDYHKITGLLLPDSGKKYGYNVYVGANMYAHSYEGLQKAVPIKSNNGSNNLPVETIFYLIIHNDRLYISAQFKDIKSGEYIGSINYNHWEVYKPNLLRFRNDDYKLEVRDKDNHIVCAICTKCSNTQTIDIGGYFLGLKTIYIKGNKFTGGRVDENIEIGSTNWQQKSLFQIEKLAPIF